MPETNQSTIFHSLYKPAVPAHWWVVGAGSKRDSFSAEEMVSLCTRAFTIVYVFAFNYIILYLAWKPGIIYLTFCDIL